jgi:hypothetical protein
VPSNLHHENLSEQIYRDSVVCLLLTLSLYAQKKDKNLMRLCSLLSCGSSRSVAGIPERGNRYAVDNQTKSGTIQSEHLRVNFCSL